MNSTTYPDRLLAKSVEDHCLPASALLAGHLEDVFCSAVSLLDGTAESMLSALNLSLEEWAVRLRKTLLLAAAIHDLGKANNHFQLAVRQKHEQPVRHEWISVWIASQPAVKQWLLPAVDGCEICWLIALYAVSGHHPGKPEPTRACFQSRAIEVLTNNDDFSACLAGLKEWLKLDTPPRAIRSILHAGAADRDSWWSFNDMRNELEKPWGAIKRQSDWKKLCAIVKATLVAADVAGSALWEQIGSPTERHAWITSSLDRQATRVELDSLIVARLKGSAPHEFQQRIAASTASVTLVEAGCGSGKTVGAYSWARDQQTGRRLWFAYPTTGTATEGYKGYLLDKLQDSETRADLFHSRAGYDLKMLLQNGEEPEDEDNDAVVRVESLKAWDTQIVTCTVDTILCLLQNWRRGMYAWPALANASIVFDEIHCYDDRLFGNLLTWIENLAGIPLLLMTASLPVGRRIAILKAVERGQRTFTHIASGPPKLESLRRYRASELGTLTACEQAVAEVKQEIAQGGRALWISNTVERTGNAAKYFDCRKLAVYHSRFIYRDRLQRHQEVVGMFDNTHTAAFASTSQVAELSLDLAYVTFLVAELAPIPALIQRLGRLARRADPDVAPPVTRKFLVIEPENDGKFSAAPYEPKELELARAWLEKLGGGDLHQRDLIDAWHELDESPEPEREASRWLNGGPETAVDSIRKSGYGVTVIWQPHAVAARGNTTEYTLPMDYPIRKNWESGRVGGYPVASKDAIHYDEFTGGAWVTSNIF